MERQHGRKSTTMTILKNIENDVGFIKERIASVEQELDAISSDLHEVRPEYLKKLQAILKEGKFSSFRNLAELRLELETSAPD